MSEIALQVDGLGKHYRIDPRQRHYGTLKDALITLGKTPFRALAGKNVRGSTQDFWAVRDVSFHLDEGTILGVIGRNGAGKSTLLKILSRITEPTTGRVEISGRVGSLLEVGTGFHPELSGMENIYLNGAILGMTRAEIDRKRDEIIAFAEIERFLQTPVKHYSSGMYMRLAFAVAAHLEPEILLIDEVLAVGDAAFQKKCLGKMDDVARDGRTILFVSHNMNAIQRLCSKCILLEQGRIAAFGSPAEVVNKYLNEERLDAAPGNWLDTSPLSHIGTGEVRVDALCYHSDRRTIGLRPYPEGPLDFTLNIYSDRARPIGSIALTMYDKVGTKLVNVDTLALGQTIQLEAGLNPVQVCIKALHLNPGHYIVGWWLSDPVGQVYDFVESGLNLEVVEQQIDRQFGVRPESDGLVTCDFQVARVG